MGRIFDVRRGEGRLALFGFAALLLLIIAGHTVLEAARDALLLTGPGPRALGAVYMVIAVGAWPAAGVAARMGQRFGPRRTLGGMLIVAAGLPVGLSLLSSSALVAMAVYVVSGIIGSVVVPEFWVLVGTALTVAQGRRLFGLIAAAGVLGGVVGSGAAAATLLVLPEKALLLLSAGIFLLAGAALIRVGAGARLVRTAPRPGLRAAGAIATLRDEPLLRRIATVVVVSTSALLVLDYCFKSTLTRSLPPAAIGPFVARYYLALNGVSLVVQLLLSGAVVRRLGVATAVVLTPLLLSLGALGVVVSGGALAVVLVMKGIDGALRHSIHRITGELAYLPVPAPARLRVKPLIDGALGRASQTITGAALLALGGTWVLAPRPLAMLVTVMTAVWLAVAVTMRRPYLALLRRALSTGTLRAHESPDPLDLESAQLLVQHLASPDAAQVAGAMTALSRRGRGGFIPALVLLHADEGVLVQALEIFGASGRGDWTEQARRLLGDRREGVRMAAARALAMHGLLDATALANDAGWRVRGYAAAHLALSDGAGPALANPGVAALRAVEGRDGELARAGMLAAVADAPPAARAAALLLSLSPSPLSSPDLVGAFARAAARQRDARLVSPLVDLLGAREGRDAVREALVGFGRPAFEAVCDALRDPRRVRRFRIHVPRTIGRFATREAGARLLEIVQDEPDGLVRYKAIRALEALAVSGRVALDRSALERLALLALERHLRLLARRAALEAAGPDAGAESPAAERLLRGLLDDKVRQSLERVFRLLHAAHPREDLDRVRLACLSTDAYARANARELLDTLLQRRGEQTLRALVRVATDDVEPAERVARASRLAPGVVPVTRDEALAALEAEGDPVLTALTRACARQPHASAAPAGELTHG